MKRVVFIAACFLALLLLCSCKEKEQNSMETPSDQTVVFRNGVKDADVWILPQTKDNLKTTLWGTATVSNVKTGESREAPLCDPGDDGLYILRMIDSSHFYYSANGIVLKAGWTMEIKGSDLHSITVEVTDENGVLNHTYEVFAARL